MRDVSKLTNLTICFGHTFKEDNFENLYKNNQSIDYNKIHSDLRYELTYGFDEFIPSFLGEFFLKKDFPNELDKKYLDILFKLSIEFKIPIFIKLNHFILNNQFSLNFKRFFGDYLPNTFPELLDKKRIVFIYSNVKENFFINTNYLL